MHTLLYLLRYRYLPFFFIYKSQLQTNDIRQNTYKQDIFSFLFQIKILNKLIKLLDRRLQYIRNVDTPQQPDH